MKIAITCISLALALAVDAVAQMTEAVSEPGVRGKIVVANLQSNVMIVVVEPGSRPLHFYGLASAQIQLAQGQMGTLADLRPGTIVAVSYTSHEGHLFPRRILIPDPKLRVPTLTADFY